MHTRTKVIEATIAATMLAVFLVLNLGLGTRKITRQIEAPYTVDDPQFLRTSTPWGLSPPSCDPHAPAASVDRPRFTLSRNG